MFIETSLKNKTDSLAGKIVKGLINAGYDIPDNHSTRHSILWNLQKAECEIKALPNGKQMLRIYGDRFSICDLYPSDDAIIIKL